MLRRTLIGLGVGAAIMLAGCTEPSTTRSLTLEGMYISKIHDQDLPPSQDEVTFVATALTCDVNGQTQLELTGEARDRNDGALQGDAIVWLVYQRMGTGFSRGREFGRGTKTSLPVECGAAGTASDGKPIWQRYRVLAVATNQSGEFTTDELFINIVPLPF